MKSFAEYVQDGIAKKQSPDLPRARALRLEAEESYSILRDFLASAGLTDKTANHVIKNAYDIIMEIIRSRMLTEGYGTSGKGAHEAEVAYLARLGFSAQEIEFADRLRYYRNGILYYGKSFDADYAGKVLLFLDRIRALKDMKA